MQTEEALPPNGSKLELQACKKQLYMQISAEKNLEWSNNNHITVFYSFFPWLYWQLEECLADRSHIARSRKARLACRSAAK